MMPQMVKLNTTGRSQVSGKCLCFRELLTQGNDLYFLNLGALNLHLESELCTYTSLTTLV